MEAVAGLERRKCRGRGRCVILDRCNVTLADRKEWLDISAGGTSSQAEERKRGVEAVFFELEPQECIRRINEREDHPTLPPERGAKAVAAFTKSLEPPSSAEGFRRVHMVRSPEEASSLLEVFGA